MKKPLLYTGDRSLAKKTIVAAGYDLENYSLRRFRPEEFQFKYLRTDQPIFSAADSMFETPVLILNGLSTEQEFAKVKEVGESLGYGHVLYLKGSLLAHEVIVEKISKETFAQMMIDEIDRCMGAQAFLAVLTTMFAFMEYMTGDGQLSDWIDKYMSLPDSDMEVLKVQSNMFWGSRNALVHGMDIHSDKRNPKGRTYSPIIYHIGIDDSARILVSSDWDENETTIEKGTRFVPFLDVVNAFNDGIRKWRDESDGYPKFVLPVLGYIRSDGESTY